MQKRIIVISNGCSIIIVNYNTRQLTADCIERIYKYVRDLIYEIIVVDNASRDDSCQYVKHHFPDVILIESKENLGFGRANNLGMQASKAKYLFLLNSDTLLKNNAPRNFFDYCEENEVKIGAVGCILKDENGNNIHSYGEFPTIKGMLRHYFNKQLKGRKISLYMPARLQNR